MLLFTARTCAKVQRNTYGRQWLSNVIFPYGPTGVHFINIRSRHLRFQGKDLHQVFHGWIQRQWEVGDYVRGDKYEEDHASSTRCIHLMPIGSLMGYDDSLWGRRIVSFLSLAVFRKSWLTSLSESKPTNQNCISLPSPPLAVGLKLGLASQLATWGQRTFTLSVISLERP